MTTVLVVASAIGGSDSWVLLAPAGCLALVGLRDDFASLGGAIRLAAQAVAAAAIVIGAVQSPPWPWATMGLAALFIVAYTNAFNFMDGVNGISALNSIVTGVWFLYVGVQYELATVSAVGACVAGAALGFLPWNAPRARVFLGDVGSYGLGALLGGLAVTCAYSGVPLALCIGPLVVYLADTGWTMARRAKRGARLVEAHREHVYQRLVAEANLRHVSAAAFTAVVSIAVIAALNQFRLGVALPLVALMIVGYLSSVRLATAWRHP